MGCYRPLYTLRVEHDYFDGNICRTIHCRISPEGAVLWHRRGLLFKQTAQNEWTIVYDSEGAGVDSSDVLVLEMYMIDPAFVLYTQWDGFLPNAAYSLELPLKKELVDAVKTIRKTAPKRGIGAGFCQIKIRLTEKLFAAAQKEMPMSCTLQFHVPEYRWEYLLDSHNGDSTISEKYLLEETGGKLHFLPFKPIKIYGRDMLRTESEEIIPMREQYGYQLKLVLPAEGKERKRTVLKHIELPELGRFMDVKLGVLRQICSL